MNPAEADIPCPNCRKSFSVPLNQIRPGSERPCPRCGARIRFGGRDAGKVQEAIDQLGRQLGNVSVKVNVKAGVRRAWWKFWG